MRTGRENWIWVLTLVFSTFMVPAVWGWYPYSEKYDNWQKNRPFLFAGLHNSVPRDHLADRIARFKAAGLNTFVWCKPANALHFFKAAHKAGIEWACWGRGGKEAITKAMAIPGNSFIMTGDEPNTTEELEVIATLSEWVRKTYPQTPVFANLSITKIDHDVYIKKCKPDIFSFDHYPLQRNGKEHRHYLYNVNWGRETARRYHLPYWMYLQAYGRELDPDAPREAWRAYRIPDEADMRYLIFSFLAHGGTGIQFFVYYGHREAMISDSEVSRPGSEPSEKQRYENTYGTRSWFAIRDVAPEVQTLARALINLRTKDPVGYTGTIPEKCKPFRGHGRLKSLANAENPKESVLVGFFDDKAGEEYFMVVNLVHGKNMSKMDAARVIRLTFDRSVEKIERLNRLTGLVETLKTKPGKAGTRLLDVHLEGGTGDLFKWSNGNPWALR